MGRKWLPSHRCDRGSRGLPWELLFHYSGFLVRDVVLDIVQSTTGAVQYEAQPTPPNEPFTLVTNVTEIGNLGLAYAALGEPAARCDRAT